MVCPAPVTHLDERPGRCRQGRRRRTRDRTIPAGTIQAGPTSQVDPGANDWPAGRYRRVDTDWRRSVRGGAKPASAVSPPAPRMVRAGTGIHDDRSAFPRGASGVHVKGPMAASAIRVSPTAPSRIPLDALRCAPRWIAVVPPGCIPLDFVPKGLVPTGVVPFAITFRRPPACARPGRARLVVTAHRSSRLNDQAHAHRCHARGRNPRRGAGR
jgi:hypothetical protein